MGRGRSSGPGSETSRATSDMPGRGHRHPRSTVTAGGCTDTGGSPAAWMGTNPAGPGRRCRGPLAQTCLQQDVHGQLADPHHAAVEQRHAGQEELGEEHDLGRAQPRLQRPQRAQQLHCRVQAQLAGTLEALEQGRQEGGAGGGAQGGAQGHEDLVGARGAVAAVGVAGPLQRLGAPAVPQVGVEVEAVNNCGAGVGWGTQGQGGRAGNEVRQGMGLGQGKEGWGWGRPRW